MQVLLYSSAAVHERLDYLFGLGVDRARVAAMVARLPQLLALDVHRNLAPKVRYLLTHLHGNAAMIASNPAYLTLSLNQRQVSSTCTLLGGSCQFCTSCGLVY